jgi:hypothetical protein
MAMFLPLFIGALICVVIGIAIGYYVGKKDGTEQEERRWKSESDYVKKEGMKIE